jgi:hypothetical protein
MVFNKNVKKIRRRILRQIASALDDLAEQELLDENHGYLTIDTLIGVLRQIKVLNPPPSLLSKLGSIIVHCKEMHGVGGHAFDLIVVKKLLTMLADAEVKEWLRAMDDAALFPIKRS